MIRHAVIATAGHVDHGKSALVKALTGTDPDRLPEEKARGITLDLGFAHLEIPAAHDCEDVFDVGIVDVPGHEDFIKNMIAGVGSIDLALLVVSADDGWMPQTEEHLQILEYLGVRHAVVALTKTDIAPETEALALENVREKLDGSTFKRAPVIATSAVTGRGLAELKCAIRESLKNLPPARDIGKPRLPIDRVFTLRGVGTVVTGTLVGGKLSRGQAVMIQPGGITARIRSMQTHNRETESAGPGMRVALNLPDAVGVARGEIVGLPGLGDPAYAWDVVLERSLRSRKAAGMFHHLKHDALVNVHFSCTMARARMVFSNKEELRPGEQCIAQLRFVSRQWAFAGDRLIIRDASGRVTLAGGVILDPNASRKHFRTASQQRFLMTAGEQNENSEALILALIERDRIVPRSQLLMRSNFGDDQIQQAISRIADKIIQRGGFLIAEPDWRKFCQLSAMAVDAHHRNHPEQTGLSLSELRAAIGSMPFASEMADLVASELLHGDFAQHGNILRRKTHRPQLPPQLRAAAAEIRAALATRSLDAPAKTAIAPDPARQEALRFLVQTGEAVELDHELVLSGHEFERARETIRRHLQQHTSATVSDLRQVLTASRRIVVPLLERLDHDGLTRRSGDSRVLRNSH